MLGRSSPWGFAVQLSHCIGGGNPSPGSTVAGGGVGPGTSQVAQEVRPVALLWAAGSSGGRENAPISPTAGLTASDRAAGAESRETPRWSSLGPALCGTGCPAPSVPQGPPARVVCTHGCTYVLSHCVGDIIQVLQSSWATTVFQKAQTRQLWAGRHQDTDFDPHWDQKANYRPKSATVDKERAVSF